MILILGEAKLSSLLTGKGYKITADPGEADLVISDVKSLSFVPDGFPLIIILSNTIYDWPAMQARPEAVFVKSEAELIDVLESMNKAEPVPVNNSGSIVVSTYANKGGVGKTTAAVSIGSILAQMQVPTVLCAMDYGGKGIESFFNLKKSQNYLDADDPMPFLIKISEYLYVLPSPYDINPFHVKSADIIRIINILKQHFSVVVCDTCPAPWEKEYMFGIFENTDLVYAVVNQSKFSIDETAQYAPKLILMGSAPEKIRIIVNQYNPKLASLREVERQFSAGLKKQKTKPKIAAVIPENWEENLRAIRRGEILNQEIWQKVCTEIEERIDYNGRKKHIKKKKLFGIF